MIVAGSNRIRVAYVLPYLVAGGAERHVLSLVRRIDRECYSSAVVALAGGTIKNLTFAVGDRVFAGGILASLNDNTVLTNLINAENNFANLHGGE